MKEPTEKEIRDFMLKANLNYYSAREQLRDIAYKEDNHNKPPHQSWGDYFKSY